MKELNLKEWECSTTEVFKTHIQEILQQATGCKISKQKAWQLYKNLIASSLCFATDMPEDSKGTKALSLAGLMKISIRKTEPKGKRAGMKTVVENGEKKLVEDASLPKWTVVPRINVKLSTALQDIVAKKYGQPVDLKEGQEFPEIGVYNPNFVKSESH